MLIYHGTSQAEAATITAGKVDVTLGGGELGRGFYTGQFYHEAIAWAWHKQSRKNASLVTVDVDENDFLNLDVVSLTGPQATAYRNNIRLSDTTRTHLFNNDIVWSPIIGSGTMRGDQHKWESLTAETLVNGPTVTRKSKP